MEAEIIVEYGDAKTSQAVAEAVSPENFKTPRDLTIKTAVEGTRVITRIEHHGRLPTVIATIDDLLFSISMAEDILQTTKSFEDARESARKPRVSQSQLGNWHYRNVK